MKRVWTPKMLNRLREQYPSANLDVLAKELGVTKNAVKTKAVVIGVKRASRFWVWSEERKIKLIELYPEHTNKEIAEFFVRRNPGCTLKQMIEGIEHHYSSNQSARGSMAQYIKSGVIKNIELKNNKLYIK